MLHKLLDISLGRYLQTLSNDKGPVIKYGEGGFKTGGWGGGGGGGGAGCPYEKGGGRVLAMLKGGEGGQKGQ